MAANLVPFSSQLPSKAVAPDGKDLVGPAADLLRGLSLLPKEGESAGIGAAFKGTPDSVSVIEAGATALSKMWAAGLGASILGIWSSVGVWWGKQGEDAQVGVLWAAAIATAALALGLAYIVGSDVRGRAAATVATLQARAAIADTFIRQAASLYKPEDMKAAAQIIPISPPLAMKWSRRKASDEKGWIASAMRFQGDDTEYWLSKGATQSWVAATDVELD
jgi:hypothetical protein